MNQEKYTERMRGFLQSAQMMALREGHQRLVPDHILKVLLDDPEGLAANLIAGGWSMEGILRLQTGAPINVVIGQDQANVGNTRQRPKDRKSTRLNSSH